ncbi:hypothetical protein ACFLV4_03075 [Chloroflexota bacterium]
MDNSEEITAEQAEPRWVIDFDWYQQNNRSLAALTRHCLCPKCREQLQTGEAEASMPDLLAAIRDCCSKAPEFVTNRLPILESVFRLILANGNQPINVMELGTQLRERLGGDTYRTSPEMLPRLLNNDRFYGLRQVDD